MNSTEPLTQIGKYKILSELGRGGMGVVYRAEDRFIGREVAIKTLVDVSPEMRQRFAIEARSGVLNHPNIVTIYDFGEHEDIPYIVMEFLHGETLERIVKSNLPLPLVDKLDIVRQVCEGLGYAHSRGVIHRDIKPANVVLLESGRVKLVDFGIAQLESLSGHTLAGSVIGTYQYLSPERLKGEASDGRGDIWSAGVLLYLLLTGSLPFPGEDISALHRVITDPYPPLGSVLSTPYPESIDNIIARALAKDPAGRYPSALEMAGDLEATRDAIRLSKVEDLLGQVRSLIDKDELLRARPLLLDLQRLAPQNTAVRNLLRELGDRLKQQPELRAAAAPAVAELARASSNGHASPSADSTATQGEPQDAAVTEEEERRRRIIEQIVAEIRAQAARGNEARALELVSRSLERAPGNAALLALQAEIQAGIEAPKPDGAPPMHAETPTALEPVSPAAPASLAVADVPPVAGIAQEEFGPAPQGTPVVVTPLVAPESTPPVESHRPLAAESLRPASVPPPAVPEPPTSPADTSPLESVDQKPALSLVREPLLPGPSDLSRASSATTDPAPPLVPFPQPLAPPMEPLLAGPASPALKSASAGPPLSVSVPTPKPLSAEPTIETPASSSNFVPTAVAAAENTAQTQVQEETLKPSAVAPAALAASTLPAPPRPVASPVELRQGLFSIPVLAATAVLLLAAVLFFALRHHSKPTSLPLTYTQIVASPYAQVLRMISADGADVPLTPGDHMTPLRVEGLRPGGYDLTLRSPDGQTAKVHCNVDALQHLCGAAAAPLSDENIRQILEGGPHP